MNLAKEASSVSCSHPCRASTCVLERVRCNGHYQPMTFREPRLASKPSRAAIALVARGFLALLFTFYVNYIPFHLLSERHLDNIALSPAQLATVHSDDHDDADHDGHDGHHKPHPSSEHTLQILPKSASVAVCIAFLPAVRSQSGMPGAAQLLSYPVRPAETRISPPSRCRHARGVIPRGARGGSIVCRAAVLSR